jgi:hypothetical protein
MNPIEDISKVSLSKKYAVCMYGQLRACGTILENLNKFLIEELNADLYLVAQYTGTDIDNYINLFNTENKIIYHPPDVTKIFINYDLLEKKNNYLDKSCLQLYYNMYIINNIFGDILEKNYEYIILTRSDYLHLFPFPNILNLCNKDDIFWCYGGHEWMGVNSTLIGVSSKYIKEYLSSFYNYLQDPSNINYLNNSYLNAEQFIKIIFDKFNWKTGKIEPNAFITATNLNELTTWSAVKYCPEKNVYYKYDGQLQQAFDSLNKYKNNKGWNITYINNMDYIILN